MSIEREMEKFEVDPDVLRAYIQKHVIGQTIKGIKFDTSGCLLSLENGQVVYFEAATGIGVASEDEVSRMGLARLV